MLLSRSDSIKTVNNFVIEKVHYCTQLPSSASYTRADFTHRAKRGEEESEGPIGEPMQETHTDRQALKAVHEDCTLGTPMASALHVEEDVSSPTALLRHTGPGITQHKVYSN